MGERFYQHIRIYSVLHGFLKTDIDYLVVASHNPTLICKTDDIKTVHKSIFCKLAKICPIVIRDF